MSEPAMRRFTSAALLSLALALAACQAANTGGGSDATDESGADDEPRTISVFDLEVDDCWTGSATDVLEVEVVACEEPHTYQVFFVSEYPGEEFPGGDELDSAADEECVAEFEDYVDAEYEESEFFVYFLVPSESTWAEGDREIICSLAQSDSSDWTGSGRGSGR